MLFTTSLERTGGKKQHQIAVETGACGSFLLRRCARSSDVNSGGVRPIPLSIWAYISLGAKIKVISSKL